MTSTVDPESSNIDFFPRIECARSILQHATTNVQLLRSEPGWNCNTHADLFDQALQLSVHAKTVRSRSKKADFASIMILIVGIPSG